jgi:hypothetical protein
VEALEGVGGVEVVELRVVRYCIRGAAMFAHRCSMARRRSQSPAGRYLLCAGGGGTCSRWEQAIFVR